MLNRNPTERPDADREPRPVEVRGDGIRVERTRTDVGVDEARQRYGGLDVPATLAGTLTAVGTTVLVAGLLAGAGTVGYQMGLQDRDELTVGGLIAGLLALLLGFPVGGWVAGRMARYDGGGNGVMAAVRFLLLGAASAALGAWLGQCYNVFDRLLPQWFWSEAATAIAVATGIFRPCPAGCA